MIDAVGILACETDVGGKIASQQDLQLVTNVFRLQHPSRKSIYPHLKVSIVQ